MQYYFVGFKSRELLGRDREIIKPETFNQGIPVGDRDE